MRTPHFALASLLLACFSCLVFTPATIAADGADKDKDKPKEKPFKYDAWCVFSDLTAERTYIPPNAPIDTETEHSRPGSEKLGGYGRRGQWAHVILDLKNTTDPKDKVVYKGEATIVLNHFKPSDTSQTTYGTTYRQAFVVAPQSEKTYHFSVYCPEEGWNERLNLEIQTENGRTYYRDFRLHDLDQRNEELIVVVSDQPGAFKYLGPTVKNVNDNDVLMGAREQAGRQVASVTPSELPTRWHDLALASLIIIDGPPSGLNPDQWDALKAYAQGGGKVLIMAGKDPARLKDPLIQDLAGITVRGSAELANLDQFSTPFPAAGEKNKELRVPIIEVSAAAGTGIVKRNSKTQMVEYCAKSYGAGMVAFLPFSLTDKMLEHWPDRALIPLNLIRAEKNLFAVDSQDEGDDPGTTPSPTYNPYNRRYQQQVRQTTLATLRNSLDTSFSNDTPVITQSPRTVMYFMLVYLACAVPLNYILFFVLRRREAAWLMAPLWALGFTIVAYYVGYSGQTGVVTVNEVCVIEAGSGQSTGVGRTFMGVYAPRRNDYQILFPGAGKGGLEVYDSQAAPGHLVNSVNVETREMDFPTMRLREDGENNIAIEDILILQRSTRRFEIQHRASLNGGLDLKFAHPNGDQSPRPQIKITNNTGRTLYNPIFIKGGEYVEISASGNATEFAPGQSFDSSTAYSNWHSADDRLIEKMSGRFNKEGPSKHDADRALAVATYLKTHMKQYAAGVFVAWADGESTLPIKIGASGSKAEDPNLSAITLLVVPAQATNRGGRAISLKKNLPKAFFASAYNPEDRSSGEWKPCDAKPIPIRTPDEQGKKCVYLRLQFDPEYGQYVYEGKAVQLSFAISSRSGRPFNGEINVLTRVDGATRKSDRFKSLYSEAIAGLTPGKSQKVKPIKFQFSDTENFTGSAIILKIQPVADDPVQLPDNIQIERVDLNLIDR